MRRSILSAVCAGLLVATGSAIAQQPIHLTATLLGFEEVPAISSFGVGTFTATLNEDLDELTYELGYSGVGGTVTQAHIHIAQRWVNGGIMVFLCSNLGNGPPGTQACPAAGTIEGSITAANIVSSAAGQGVRAGNFYRFQRALRQDVAYVNVHSDRHPGGEIRGQRAGPHHLRAVGHGSRPVGREGPSTGWSKGSTGSSTPGPCGSSRVWGALLGPTGPLPAGTAVARADFAVEHREDHRCAG